MSDAAADGLITFSEQLRQRLRRDLFLVCGNNTALVYPRPEINCASYAGSHRAAALTSLLRSTNVDS